MDFQLDQDGTAPGGQFLNLGHLSWDLLSVLCIVHPTLHIAHDISYVLYLMRCKVIEYDIMLYDIMLYYIILQYILLHDAILYYIAVCYMI